MRCQARTASWGWGGGGGSPVNLSPKSPNLDKIAAETLFVGNDSHRLRLRRLSHPEQHHDHNNNNKIQHLYSAIFTKCSMALYIVSRITLKNKRLKNIYIFIHLNKKQLQFDLHKINILNKYINKLG